MPKSLFRVDLRRLILWLCLFFVFLALGNSLYAAYRVQHGLLLQNSLDKISTYTNTLAQVTDSFLKSSAQVLETAALDVTDSRLDPVATQKELEQLANVTAAFNAIVAVDASGKIFAAVPQQLGLVGTQLQTPQARQLLNAKETTAVSDPFKSPRGRWLSIIAHPIFSSDGQYGGFIGGAVFLQSESALQNTLEEHQYLDGSYFYIVDRAGIVMQHPKQALIGTSFKDKPPVAMVLQGKSGMQRITDAESHDLHVSYAPIPSTNWGVVVQRPTQHALSNIGELFWRTFFYALPLFILSLLAIWWLARLIARPLHDLADVAANLDNHTNFSRIRFVKGWYYEAALIQKGLLRGFSAVGMRIRKLQREGTTDALTGLINRRGLDAALSKLADTGQKGAVVAYDIDHFKAVNDQHGHAAGDEVLKKIAALSLATARKEDVVARLGGEEFVVLLPGEELESARRFAERLRHTIEQANFDSVKQVTVSLGIACYPGIAPNVHDALFLADTALYQAKASGRNQACVAPAR